MNRLPVIALRIAGWMLALVVAVAAVFALVRAAAVDDADLAAVALMEVAPPPRSTPSTGAWMPRSRAPAGSSPARAAPTARRAR